MTDNRSQDTGSPVDGETTLNTAGPTLLADRSVGGILVHFIAIPTSIVGAGIVYLFATNEFTKQNARNALDWHLTVLVLTIITFGSLFLYPGITEQGITPVAALPSFIATMAVVTIFGLLALWVVVQSWTLLVGLVATGQAMFGTAWRYPFSPPLVDRYLSDTALFGR